MRFDSSKISSLPKSSLFWSQLDINNSIDSFKENTPENLTVAGQECDFSPVVTCEGCLSESAE